MNTILPMNLTIITITLCYILAFQVVPFIRRRLEPPPPPLAEEPEEEPMGELADFIGHNSMLYDYWITKGNQDYANAHKMLINAFTIIKKDEPKPESEPT